MERSAGGVVFREGQEGPEIILISPRGSGRWQLPKGLVEAGESTEQAARREVAEETGVRAEVLDRLGEIDYWYRNGEGTLLHKFVEFFLMSYLGGDPSSGNEEVDRSRWFPVDEAILSLSFDTERAMVEKGRLGWHKLPGRPR